MSSIKAKLGLAGGIVACAMFFGGGSDNNATTDTANDAVIINEEISELEQHDVDKIDADINSSSPQTANTEQDLASESTPQINESTYTSPQNTSYTTNEPAYQSASRYSAESETAEDPDLPLKATCKDGTISYQDNPSLPNYRGMCSHHGGIAKRHGRTP